VEPRCSPPPGSVMERRRSWLPSRASVEHLHGLEWMTQMTLPSWSAARWRRRSLPLIRSPTQNKRW
jgi:hypothetical protein